MSFKENIFNYPVRKNSNPIEVAMDIIIQRYGTHCFPDEGIEKDDHWIVPINVNTMREIINRDGDLIKRIIFLWKNVDNLKIEKKSLKISKSPSRRELLHKIKIKKTEVVEKAESIMIQAADRNFGKILYTRHQNTIINPLITLIDNFVKRKSLPLDQYFYPSYNFEKQGKILFEENFIEKSGPNIVTTNLFLEKLSELTSKYHDSHEDITASLLGYLFYKYYDYLKKDCHIYTLNPFINFSLSYYIPALYYKDLLAITNNDLKKFLKDFFNYKPRSKVHFDRILNNLTNNEILKTNGNNQNPLIRGSEEIYDFLNDRRNQFINEKYVTRILDRGVSFG